MIDNTVVLLLLAFLNTGDPTGNTMYGSGIKDCDQAYYSVIKATPYAVLRTPYSFYTPDGEMVYSGMYDCIYDLENNKLVLRQSNKVYARLPIISYKKFESFVKVPKTEIDDMQNNYYQITLRQDDYEVTSVVLSTTYK